MSIRPVPRVSIGLPVYNGENYLAETLDSIRAQTYADFELIISDNASNDRTAEICGDYASSDRRIRYVRNDRNLGAIPNYNQTLDLSCGELFKWNAHDDLIAPTCLEKCVASLDANPDAILCQSLVEFIDATGKSLGVYDSQLLHIDAPQPSVRFADAVLLPHACTEVFGVMRKSLVGPVRHGNFHSADRAFIAELALRGRILQVREPLFLMRDHPTRYTRTAHRPQDRKAWHAGQTPRRHYPTWKLYADYWRMIPQHVADQQERMRCYGHLLSWWFTNWNWARMGVDVLAVFQPDIVARAERFKQRRFDPEPGPARAKPRESFTQR